MSKMLASSVEVVAWVKPTNPPSQRLVRLFLAGRCFDYYDGVRKANCHIGEMLCRFGMVRSQWSPIIYSCIVLRRWCESRLIESLRIQSQYQEGKSGLSIDIYMNRTRVRFCRLRLSCVHVLIRSILFQGRSCPDSFGH